MVGAVVSPGLLCDENSIGPNVGTNHRSLDYTGHEVVSGELEPVGSAPHAPYRGALDLRGC
jgi:hypothetical protein